MVFTLSMLCHHEHDQPCFHHHHLLSFDTKGEQCLPAPWPTPFSGSLSPPLSHPSLFSYPLSLSIQSLPSHQHLIICKSLLTHLQIQIQNPKALFDFLSISRLTLLFIEIPCEKTAPCTLIHGCRESILPQPIMTVDSSQWTFLSPYPL